MILKYDCQTGRYNNFHCGYVFKIKVNEKWKTVRIEFFKNWYVIDEDGFTCSCDRLEGLSIEEF